MRILIIGDSLTYYPIDIHNDIYGIIIKKYFETTGNDKVFIIGKADNHSRTQSCNSRLFYDIKQFEPDVVVIHLGINDCAPRLFSEIDELYIRSLPFYMRLMIIKFFSRYRLFFTKRFFKVHVEINDFKINFQKILTEIINYGSDLIIVNIARPSNRHSKRSYNFLNNIKRYNKVLYNLAIKNNCILIDMFSIIETEPKLRLEDGIHLSKYGHRKLAEILIKEINYMKNKKFRKVQ